MSANSNIEWTDATWNVVIGCDKVSPGCDHCYAIRTAHRMSANPNEKIAAAYAGTELDGEWTGKVNLIHDRLDLPLRWTKPKKIFVNAQSDLFHADVPDEFIARVFAVMACAQQHTFQILTKRPGRGRSLLSSPAFQNWVYRAINIRPIGERADIAGTLPLSNVWLGVSVEDQKRADLRVPNLLATPAAVRFLSCEPLLGPVCLDAFHSPDGHQPGADLPCEAWPEDLDWVIVGGESGPGARPMHPDWARSLRDQCVEAGVAFHFKQWGEWAPDGYFVGDVRVLNDREYAFPGGSDLPSGYTHRAVRRVGKKAAGRVLDGRTWDEFPQAVTV